MTKDYYAILGISKDATEDEIKKSYKKNVMRWHPDRWAKKPESEQKKAEEKFKEIAEAYEVLSDKDKKRRYDMFGTAGFGGGGYGDSRMDANDIFAAFMYNAGFGDFGSFRQKRKERHYRGTDKKISIPVTLEDVYFNRFKTVRYKVERPCGECNGKGTMDGMVDMRCPYCGGDGAITEVHDYNGMIVKNTQTCPHCGGTGILVKNPCKHCGGTGVVEEDVERGFGVPNIDKIQYMYKIELEGNSCNNSLGRNGDLYHVFTLNEDPGSKFKLDESNMSDIYSTIEVPVFDCLVGCEKTVRTINGKALKLKIPKGTKDGHEFTLGKYGMKLSNGSVGDFIVKVEMTMPEIDGRKIAKIKKILEEG